MNTEILVVGAGPVGLTLALALRRQGLGRVDRERHVPGQHPYVEGGVQGRQPP